MTKTLLDTAVNPFASDNAPEDLQPEAALAAAVGRETPETPETPPETPETPPETPESTPETPETRVRHPSRKDLTVQLESATTELEKLRADGAVYDQKYKDAVAKQAELEKQVADRDKDFVKARTPVYRWEDDPEVATPRREIVELLTDVAAEVTPETSNIIKKDLPLILTAYGEARSMGAEALRQFKDKLSQNFGDDAPTIWGSVKAMYPKHTAALEAESRNRAGFLDRTMTEHATRSRQYRDEFLQIGKMTPEQIAANPDDFNSVISAAIAGDEGLQKEIERMALQAAQATAGLPPLSDNATPEQIQAYRQTERNLREFKEKNAFRRDVEARALKAVVKKLVDENAALKKRVTGSVEANRPEATTTTAPAAKPAKPVGEYAEVHNPYLIER
jgi:hypothetical protein